MPRVTKKKRKVWINSGVAPRLKSQLTENIKELKRWGFTTRLSKVLSGSHKGKYRIMIKETQLSKRKLKRVDNVIKRLKREKKR